MKIKDDEGVENLSFGIIKQAVEDYVQCYWGDGKENRLDMDEVCKFFNSKWYSTLTNTAEVDAKMIIKKALLDSLKEIHSFLADMFNPDAKVRIRAYVSFPHNKKFKEKRRKMESKELPASLVAPLLTTFEREMIAIEREIEFLEKGGAPKI